MLIELTDAHFTDARWASKFRTKSGERDNPDRDKKKCYIESRPHAVVVRWLLHKDLSIAKCATPFS